MKKQVILSKDNAKTIKGEKEGIKTFIVYLAPYMQNNKGINLCSHASEGCVKSCLFGSGRGGMFTSVEEARVKKTNFFVNNRTEFLTQLIKEIKSVTKNNKNVFIRLNGTSDIPFEKFKIEGKNIFQHFPSVQFYDYTKNHIRMYKYLNNEFTSNYHLTFSRSETNEKESLKVLSSGGSVAMVFDKLPTEYYGYKVIDGDINDLRPLDEKNVIIGLKFKKLTKKGADNLVPFETNFVIKTIK